MVVERNMKYIRIIPILIIIVASGWFVSESIVFSGENTDSSTTNTNDPSEWEEQMGELSKSDDGQGRVTMTVEYKPDESTDEISTFEIFLNTHSVDLETVDFQKDIVVKKDDRELLPITVETEGEGHHRSATVTFPAVEKPFTISGKNIAGITERSIVWD